jgi:hypothetical protein
MAGITDRFTRSMLPNIPPGESALLAVITRWLPADVPVTHAVKSSAKPRRLPYGRWYLGHIGVEEQKQDW